MAKILAIDDSADNLIVISALLKNLIPDCEVLTAATGTEGLNKAAVFEPDAILLDIIMPEIDGYEICCSLKSNNVTRHIPIIMITAVETDTSSRIKGLECGADAFMTKPIDEAELVAQVKVALRIKKAEDQLRKEKDLLENLVLERTKSLRESERRFRSLVENVPVGISIVQNDMVVYQNPAQMAITGGFGKPFEIRKISLVHPDDYEKLHTYYQDVLTHKTSGQDITLRFYSHGKARNKKELKWVQCRADIVEYKDEKAVMFCMLDITKSKELERLVIIEDKMASLGRVAAGMAHEIRNPLSSINIYLSILDKSRCTIDDIDDETEETIAEALEKIGTASQKIESVIKRALDFSRPNIPKATLVNINECIQKTVDIAAISLRKAGIALNVNLQPDVPDCYMDSQTMMQVLLNLITNASEAMADIHTGKAIQIRSFRKKNVIGFSVADNGPGVPENIRNTVLEPFFTTKPNGSGIGLSFSHRIIADHGGRIEITESDGGGAKFSVRLPIKRDKESYNYEGKKTIVRRR